jgi:hypothetical protein
MTPPLMYNCGLDDDERDEEEEDTACQQPYAIKTILLPVLPVPQCLAKPVDCRADFELYRQSTQ